MIYSCSLPCFKSHQNQCQVLQTEPDAPSQNQSPSAQLSHSESPNDKQPPRGLTAKDVELLFQKHPALKTKLNAIYQSTLDQARDSSESNRRRDLRNGMSSEEKAFSRGLQLLKQKLSDDSNDEDVAAFASYVNTLAHPS